MEMEFLRVLHCSDISEYNALAQYKLEKEYKTLKIVNVCRSMPLGFDVFYTELDQIINLNSSTATFNGTPINTY